MSSVALTGHLNDLYRRAFREFGAMALWNVKQLPLPTSAHALIVARALRQQGDLRARRLAEEIEAACRAAN
jgi:hypothetical protein